MRQWAGLAPPGYLVPEGFDDCVVELSSRSTWIQAKSRKTGNFGDTEVRRILDAVDERASSLSRKTDILTAVVLEQPCTGNAGVGIESLCDGPSRRVVVCRTPDKEIVSLIARQLDVAPLIAEGIASDLYKLVAEASSENASRSYGKRRRISTAEIERRIFERLEAEDPSAIDEALSSGVLAPVDFVTAIREPGFYRGVKVRPGHVAAGLVVARPADTANVVRLLTKHTQVLVTGPSGAGKSALVWLSAYALAGEMRWFQITSTATAADAQAVIRFFRSRQPTDHSPIGVVFDDVGTANSDLWNILAREIRGLGAIHLLGSVRQEDLAIIANRADTHCVSVRMNEGLAETIWQELCTENGTSWSHWREPFEQSGGLLLEYVHLLTQGDRLAAVIEEQIQQREDEGRNDELAIIRGTAVLCASGGEVEARSLFELLGLNADSASRSLRRLIDEHLVLESRPGVLGGLHMLRSKALVLASHDGAAHMATDTLWRCLPAVTSDSLPRVIHTVLATDGNKMETHVLGKLAKMLARNSEVGLWVAVLTGLGLATLEKHVSSFVSVLEQHGLPRALWGFASILAVSGIEGPELTQFEQWRNIQDSVRAFRVLPKEDLRPACLRMLPTGTALPRCQTLQEFNKLLSCLVPFLGTNADFLPSEPEFTVPRKPDIQEVARLLSTAYLISPGFARTLACTLGGEQNLLDLFHEQTAWVTEPRIQSCGPHGRTIRSDLFHVSDEHQRDPNEVIIEICETLIALSPDADAAACDANDPMGQRVAIGDLTPWSKNMPRHNIPAKARVAWNVAFRQILLSKAAEESLTVYVQAMAKLVQRTEKVFRAFTEKWIKNRGISNAPMLAAEANDIVSAVGALAYIETENPSTEMTEPPKRAGINDDSLGALLNGILGNLLRRLGDISDAKAAATFAGSLAAQAREHHDSEIWRASSSPPLPELAALSARLEDVACILHEFADVGGRRKVQRIAKSAKRAGRDRSTAASARYCRTLANRRFAKRLADLESKLSQEGFVGHTASRPINESDSPYWPARQIAVLAEMPDTETEWLGTLDDCFAIVHQELKEDWPFRVVPVVDGHVIGSLALCNSSQGPFPDLDFARDWSKHIRLPILQSEAEQKLSEGIASCHLISGILTCRGTHDLHPEEERALSDAVNSFHRTFEAVTEAAENTGLDQWMLVFGYLDQTWNQIVEECETANSAQPIKNPYCMTAHNLLAGLAGGSEQDLLATRMLMLQAECGRTVLDKSDGE